MIYMDDADLQCTKRVYACDMSSVGQDGREMDTHQVIIRFAVVATFQIFALNESFNPLLDCQRVRLESGSKLASHLIDQVVMGHMLSILHDTDNTCLWNLVNRIATRRAKEILPPSGGVAPHRYDPEYLCALRCFQHGQKQC